MPPTVYIIIINYKQWKDTTACLHSLFQSSVSSYTLFIVDNASENDSLQHIREWIGYEKKRIVLSFSQRQFAQLITPVYQPGEIYLIQNETNTGFAGANNIVLRQLLHTDACIWLLNPDMTVEKDCLQNLLRFYTHKGGKAVAGAAVFSYTDNQRLLFYGGGKVNLNTATIRPLLNKTTGRPDYISGSCLFTGTAVFRQVGLLPEQYFLYWEETDWCRQAIQKGYPLLVCPDAICYDKISTVIGRGFLADYYYTRNGLYFIQTYAPGKRRLAMFFVLIRYGKRLLTGQWQRARGVRKGFADFLKNKAHAIE